MFYVLFLEIDYGCDERFFVHLQEKGTSYYWGNLTVNTT